MRLPGMQRALLAAALLATLALSGVRGQPGQEQAAAAPAVVVVPNVVLAAASGAPRKPAAPLEAAPLAVMQAAGAAAGAAQSPAAEVDSEDAEDDAAVIPVAGAPEAAAAVPDAGDDDASDEEDSADAPAPGGLEFLNFAKKCKYGKNKKGKCRKKPKGAGARKGQHTTTTSVGRSVTGSPGAVLQATQARAAPSSAQPSQDSTQGPTQGVAVPRASGASPARSGGSPVALSAAAQGISSPASSGGSPVAPGAAAQGISPGGDGGSMTRGIVAGGGGSQQSAGEGAGSQGAAGGTLVFNQNAGAPPKAPQATTPWVAGAVSSSAGAAAGARPGAEAADADVPPPAAGSGNFASPVGADQADMVCLSQCQAELMCTLLRELGVAGMHSKGACARGKMHARCAVLRWPTRKALNTPLLCCSCLLLSPQYTGATMHSILPLLSCCGRPPAAVLSSLRRLEALGPASAARLCLLTPAAERTGRCGERCQHACLAGGGLCGRRTSGQRLAQGARRRRHCHRGRGDARRAIRRRPSVHRRRHGRARTARGAHGTPGFAGSGRRRRAGGRVQPGEPAGRAAAGGGPSRAGRAGVRIQPRASARPAQCVSE